MPPVHKIPLSIDDVSHAWLGITLGAEVTRQHRTQIGQGVGLMGDIYRIELEYAKESAASLPTSVVVKLPSSFEENREQGVALGMFEAEVRFYNELAPKDLAGLPRVFHAEVEAGTANFVIVMEDLTTMTMVNQSDGMTGEQALAVVRMLANLHAVWWNKVDTPDMEWIPAMDGPRIDFVNQLLAQVFPAFKTNFGADLPVGGIEIYEAFLGNYPKINQLITKRSPWTLAHQDFRVENLMFGIADPNQVVVLDWQGIGRGPGAFDLGYVLGGSMEPDVRRSWEYRLLAAYHEQLELKGVKNYSLTQLTEDYAHSHLMGGLAIGILTGGSFDLSNERGAELVKTMARRHVIAALDHGAAKRLAAIV